MNLARREAIKIGNQLRTWSLLRELDKHNSRAYSEFESVLFS